MKSSTSIFPRWRMGSLTVVTAVAILSGCNRKPPLEQIVVAPSEFKLTMWKADVAGDFTRQEWLDFEAAVQEIKYGIMIAKEASGSAGVEAAMLQKIDGLSVRAVLKMGLGHKLERLMRERGEFATYIEHNQELRVGAGDEESADYLRLVREHQERRIDRLDEQIRATAEIFRRRGIAIEDRAVKPGKPALSAPF